MWASTGKEKCHLVKIVMTIEQRVEVQRIELNASILLVNFNVPENKELKLFLLH